MATAGVLAGRVVEVAAHPNGDNIRLAQVDLGGGRKVQIVFGGPDIVRAGHLVAVAPPGSRVPSSRRKIRNERFREQESHGMLCSLTELGWALSGPDEVALLREVVPGSSMDGLAPAQRRRIVVPPALSTELLVWSET